MHALAVLCTVVVIVPIWCPSFSVFQSLFFKILTEAGSRTSFSPTEWVDLPEQDGGEQSAGLRLAPVIQPNTRTGREQTCSRQGGLSFYGSDKGDD